MIPKKEKLQQFQPVFSVWGHIYTSVEEQSCYITWFVHSSVSQKVYTWQFMIKEFADRPLNIFDIMLIILYINTEYFKFICWLKPTCQWKYEKNIQSI